MRRKSSSDSGESGPNAWAMKSCPEKLTERKSGSSSLPSASALTAPGLEGIADRRGLEHQRRGAVAGLWLAAECLVPRVLGRVRRALQTLVEPLVGGDAVSLGPGSGGEGGMPRRGHRRSALVMQLL